MRGGRRARLGHSRCRLQAAGGTIVADADDIFAEAEMVVKVKEPLPDERKRLRRGQILFTYLHLAPDAGADAATSSPPARPASPTRR